MWLFHISRCNTYRFLLLITIFFLSIFINTIYLNMISFLLKLLLFKLCLLQFIICLLECCLRFLCRLSCLLRFRGLSSCMLRRLFCLFFGLRSLITGIGIIAPYQNILFIRNSVHSVLMFLCQPEWLLITIQTVVIVIIIIRLFTESRHNKRNNNLKYQHPHCRNQCNSDSIPYEIRLNYHPRGSALFKNRYFFNRNNLLGIITCTFGNCINIFLCRIPVRVMYRKLNHIAVCR